MDIPGESVAIGMITPIEFIEYLVNLVTVGFCQAHALQSPIYVWNLEYPLSVNNSDVATTKDHPLITHDKMCKYIQLMNI